MASSDPTQFDWASHDRTRIELSELFHDWRVTWDELQQQRVGGPQAHRDLIQRMADLEARIEQAMANRSAPPA